jgi:PPOX class probable F420-dependent enzyme
MGEFDPRLRFTQSQVARLATVNPDGRPHLIPVVFAVEGDTVYTAIDAKPKTTQRLRRLDNIEHDRRVGLLVDHYDDDWTQLWWVRADGLAAIHRHGEPMQNAYRLLRAKYPQYQSVALTGPVIAVDVSRWSHWHA